MSNFGKIACIAAVAFVLFAGGAVAYDTCSDCPASIRGKYTIPLRKKKVRCNPCGPVTSDCPPAYSTSSKYLEGSVVPAPSTGGYTR